MPIYIQRVDVTKTSDRFEAFASQFSEGNEPATVADKLKWHRLRKGLYQKEVAQALGVDRTTYSRYEEGLFEAYPFDKLTLAAQLFGVDVTELLDDYNRFLYQGQGITIKNLRKRLGLTQRELAARLGVSTKTVKGWEQERVSISRKCYERLRNFCK